MSRKTYGISAKMSDKVLYDNGLCSSIFFDWILMDHCFEMVLTLFLVIWFIVIVVIASSCAQSFIYGDGKDVVTTESDITDLSENEDTYNMFYDKRRD